MDRGMNQNINGIFLIFPCSDFCIHFVPATFSIQNPDNNGIIVYEVVLIAQMH